MCLHHSGSGQPSGCLGCRSLWTVDSLVERCRTNVLGPVEDKTLALELFWGAFDKIPGYSMLLLMAHTIRDKKKLLNRLRRIRGQVEAIERLVEQEEDCSAILQTIAACRGAVNGLMAEVIEGHIRFHIVDPNHQPTSQRARAAQELIEVVQTYLK